MAPLVLTVKQTYELLPLHLASLARDGKKKKVHKWSLRLDSPDRFDISQVTYSMHPSFQPREYCKESPPFKTVQTSWGLINVDITVQTRGGEEHNLGSFPIRTEDHEERYSLNLPKRRADHLHAFSSELPPDTFGIELELTHDTLTPEEAAQRITRASGYPVQYGRDPTWQSWSIVHDGSVRCTPSQPASCTTFELVSPKLRGSSWRGVEGLRSVVRAAEDLGVKVNRTAGFHVHINASNLRFAEVRQLAQAFLKYEAVFDTVMPASRRGSANGYCLSNVATVAGGEHLDGDELHARLQSASSMRELVDMVSPTRYHKLNLQNLIEGGKHTLEFRHHSATSSVTKVEAWVRLLLLFVQAARERPSAKAFKDSTPVEERFERLFEWVVKDRELHEYYAGRVQELRAAGALEDQAFGRLCNPGCARQCCATDQSGSVSRPFFEFSRW